MSEDSSLTAAVRKLMGDLIATYELAVVEVSSNEVLLRSSTYSLDIASDRDGVTIVYFDTSVKPAKGYNIFLFLFSKRHDDLQFAKEQPVARTLAEFLESEVRALGQHMRTAGSDILAGSKEWIRSYYWSPINADSEIADLLCSR